MPSLTDRLNIHFSEPRSASGQLNVLKFRDHDFAVCYIPSLNLSAYGDTHKEALERLFQEVFKDFIDSLTLLGNDRGTKELEKLGWKRNQLFKKRFVSESYIDKAGVLKNFNLPNGTPVESEVVEV